MEEKIALLEFLVVCLALDLLQMLGLHLVAEEQRAHLGQLLLVFPKTKHASSNHRVIVKETSRTLIQWRTYDMRLHDCGNADTQRLP
eukprot:scaffold278493_cov18-Prasinocladus_malaysianus.AAC.2